MKLRPALVLASSAMSAAPRALAAPSRRYLAFASAQPAESGDGAPPSSVDADSSSTEADDLPEVPQLPAAKPADDPTVPVLKLGDSMSFEELGPVIINADGTTRRIDNWGDMTEREREVAWRRISRRNRERREALEAKQAARTEEEPHPPRMKKEPSGLEGGVEPSGGEDEL